MQTVELHANCRTACLLKSSLLTLDCILNMKLHANCRTAGLLEDSMLTLELHGNWSYMLTAELHAYFGAAC